jgi:glyoxalase family protein
MEICTTGPGFQLDEKLEDLGDRLCLSPRVEPLRAKLESELTPIINPRPRSKAKKAKSSAPPSANGVPSEPATVS